MTLEPLKYKVVLIFLIPPNVMNKDLQVGKSNYLVEASYKLSLQEQRLVLASLSKVNSKKEIPKTVTLTASEFSELMGIDMKYAHQELYKAVDKLSERWIVVDGEERSIRWIQEKAFYRKGEGKVEFVWSDKVLKYISQLKSRFTTYKLKHIANLQSPYSIRLYELLMQWNTTKERVIYLDSFRKMFQLEDKYPEFKELNKFVIKPAVAELNKSSDLTIHYETIKQGRSVVALAFDFKESNQMKLAL